MTGSRVLRDLANGLARSTLAPLPLRFWQGVFPKDLIALCYHMVSDRELAHFKLDSYKNSAEFEADVLFVRSRAITYRNLADHRLGGTPVPANSILFTFDDGFAQCYDVIRPILLRHGVDAAFFVTTDFIDDRVSFPECSLSLCLSAVEQLPSERIESLLSENRIDDLALSADTVRYSRAVRRIAKVRAAAGSAGARRTLYLWVLGLGDDDTDAIERACRLLEVDPKDYAQRQPIFMSRAQIRQLAEDGFTIGAHGLNHRLLEGCDPFAIEREMIESARIVQQVTGQERVPFAFPHSGLAVEREAIARILSRNPLVDLVFDSGCLRRDCSFIVNRVFADETLGGSTTSVPSALRRSWSVPSAWFRAR